MLERVGIDSESLIELPDRLPPRNLIIKGGAVIYGSRIYKLRYCHAKVLQRQATEIKYPA